MGSLHVRAQLLEMMEYEKYPQHGILIRALSTRALALDVLAARPHTTRSDRRGAPGVVTVPNYLSVVAKPPRRPPRHFCVVCGEAGPYTHPIDGARYARDLAAACFQRRVSHAPWRTQTVLQVFGGSQVL